MAVTLKLARPIEAHGGTIAELSIREPTGTDIRVCGVPMIAAVDPDTQEAVSKFDAGVVAKLIARLANIPPSSVDKLSAADWTSAMGIVVGFFGDAGQTSSTATTTAPASGTTSDTSSS